MKQKFASALSLALILAMLFTSVGLADNVQNDVATVGGVKLVTITAGDTTGATVYYNIKETSGDSTDPTGKNAQTCNAADGSPAKISPQGMPVGVTTTPTFVEFTDCATAKGVTFKAAASTVPTDYTITVSVNDVEAVAGDYNTSPASFVLRVLPAEVINTSPTVIVTGVSNGTSYAKGSVPAAGCSVIDAEDGNSSFSATLDAVTGPDASDGIGSQTASCSYTDAGGLIVSASATYSIGDPSAPSIYYVLAPPADGSNGWYKSNVTLTWSVTENESPSSLQKTGCVDQNITADQFETTYSCSASSVGGSAGPVSVSIKRDATAPTITAQRDTTANVNGWNNTDVVASYTASDTTSGLASPASGSYTFALEGTNQSHTFNVDDNAGNSASATVIGINIDKTAPTASASASPAPNANGWNKTAVTVSFTGSDNLSGVDFCDAAVVLSSEGAGQSASGKCTDKAGNASAAATASGINIDKTAPTVALVGGPANGGTYYFGFVPAGPTCSASDALSGVDGTCSVSGYSNALGTHTVSSSATDKAGNSASASATYTVLAWTLKGFYQPVDMNGVVNTVKGGSTVPLKFEVFAGNTELTDTSVVSTWTKEVTCNASTEDTIEVLSTGGTSLRYDFTSGQFIYNWQTPKLAGHCYTVTMKTQDGSSIVALFKLK